jgi:hypothetical protein
MSIVISLTVECATVDVAESVRDKYFPSLDAVLKEMGVRAVSADWSVYPETVEP